MRNTYRERRVRRAGSAVGRKIRKFRVNNLLESIRTLSLILIVAVLPLMITVVSKAPSSVESEAELSVESSQPRRTGFGLFPLELSEAHLQDAKLTGDEIPQFMCPWKIDQEPQQEMLVYPGEPPLPHVDQCGWTPDGVPFLCEC